MFWSDFILALTNQGLRPVAKRLLSILFHPQDPSITEAQSRFKASLKVSPETASPGAYPAAVTARSPSSRSGTLRNLRAGSGSKAFAKNPSSAAGNSGANVDAGA